MTSMACIESDDTREPGEEVERPFHVEAVPLADCGHPRPFCRGLCRSCYRKLGEADALPPPMDPGPRRRHPLQRWLGTLDNALLIQLKAWIEELTR